MNIKHVCAVTREYEGVAGAGGLKDAVRGLGEALAGEGIRVTVIMPRYGFVELKDNDVRRPSVRVLVWGQVRTLNVISRQVGNVEVLLLDAPEFSSKYDIYTYTAEDAPSSSRVGQGHQDQKEMNVLLQAGSVAVMLGWNTAPDVVHCHDAHTALVPLYMRKLPFPFSPAERERPEILSFFDRTGVLTTIHNAGEAYQQVPGDLRLTSELTGFSQADLAGGLVDKKVNPFLLAGIHGLLNTVSPGYAQELMKNKDGFSGGLSLALAQNNIQLTGIYNGLDIPYWLKDSGYSRSGWKKTRLKHSLREQLAEELRGGVYPEIQTAGTALNAGKLWILFHGRLSEQKGIEEILALQSLPPECQFVVYGRGNPEIEEALKKKASSESNWIFLRGYNAQLTRKIIACSSLVAVPSLWEPCGQIDMAAQLLGALPVVRNVGGLKKVRNRMDGYCFSAKNKQAFAKKLHLALKWEKNRFFRVQRMRRRAENSIYGYRSWQKVAVRGYIPLFKKAARR